MTSTSETEFDPAAVQSLRRGRERAGGRGQPAQRFRRLDQP